MNRVVLVVCVLLCLPLVTNAQKKPAVATSSLCTKDNALETTKQQILFSRTIDNQAQRIGVLLRAADLLWPHDQEKAFAAFMEAFELAVEQARHALAQPGVRGLHLISFRKDDAVGRLCERLGIPPTKERDASGHGSTVAV